MVGCLSSPYSLVGYLLILLTLGALKKDLGGCL
jgi:hypothetical protein